MTPAPVTIIGTRDVPITELHPHPENPNHGDTDAIRESLDTFGQYRAIVALADGTILAGHHVYKAAAARGDKTVRVEIIDTDPQTARKILLADNRIAELGPGLDPEELLAALQNLDDDLLGTGYDESFIDDLLAAQEEKAPAPTPGDVEGQGIGTREDSYFNGEDGQRMIVLAYPKEEYSGIVDSLAELGQAYGTETNADTVRTLIEQGVAILRDK